MEAVPKLLLPALYGWKQLLIHVPTQIGRVLTQYVINGILGEASLSNGSLRTGSSPPSAFLTSLEGAAVTTAGLCDWVACDALSGGQLHHC